MRKFFSTQTFKLGLLIFIQIVAVLLLIFNALSFQGVIYNTAVIFGGLIGISIFGKDDLNPVYKLLWICIIAVLPFLGAVIYLLWGDRKIAKKKAGEINKAVTACKEAREKYKHTVSPDILEGGEKASAKYLLYTADSPVYENTLTEYYSCGEDFFKSLTCELEKAEKFIFMEYFIIKNGYMWDKIYNILEKKAKAGVDIRIVYDSFGSVIDFPENFRKNMQDLGIKCYVFNPMKFSWKITDYTFLNHRDHRKICVIDGNVGFTGGINISDEYINKINLHGHWKDTAVMLKGEGVYSFTTTFLKMWEFVTKTNENYLKYIPTKKYQGDGYVQAYDDSPLDVENVSENSYFNVIYHARKYVYIATPYLVIDNEMVTTLSLAAKSGVDVRIITPGIPDKKYVYYLTQSFYPELIRAGVRIFEYTPGFIHAKMFIRDDEQAIVGSANLDYRSLYLHFENCCALYGGKIICDIKKDFDNIFKDCHEITHEDIKKVPRWKRIIQLFLKFLAPVM
ncbi:MAG: cardiolipin synthase [Clostridia bacterium]|nr:cardiolipin synthase [Clostridia bacterium]